MKYGGERGGAGEMGRQNQGVGNAHKISTNYPIKIGIETIESSQM